MDEFLEDAPYVDRRAAGGVIDDEEGFNKNKLKRFVDLALQENSIAWRRFWRKAFKVLDSTDDENENPVLRQARLIDTKVKVGALRRDHPPSIAYPEQDQEGRRQGDPVYPSLTLNFQVDSINWMWKEARERFFNPAHIDFNIGSEAKCLDRAITRYDRSLRERIDEYNEKLVIKTPRRRVVHFAETGPGHGPSVRHDTEEFAGLRIEHVCNVISELRELRLQDGCLLTWLCFTTV
ncbi:hypothetical protein NW762_009481 [Fusarium torreyae]|uniref:Uncharacterized protein n=1 Tax=Fusarium torreyae TaxID=1237075 RepID=A0A9W8RUX2_9HYPO|nr:hypothetical protein NW762_009481 [Fusarium torreyae]